MAKPPPYISIFFTNHVRVSYSTKALREAIVAAGYEVFKDEYCVCNVRIDRQSSCAETTEQLDKILLALNDLDVLFGEDYKQAMASADYMRDLQERRILRKPFKSIGWGGPEGSIIRTFEPEDS